MDLSNIKSTLKNQSWMNIFQKEFDKSYFNDIENSVIAAYKSKSCYPPSNLIFNAFNLCDYSNLKVVIIGQDPYHQPNQANGLAFSINKGVKAPPSLINIFKELENDLQVPFPVNGSLETWARQGVLLLNTVLTVEEDKPGSHKDFGWLQFTRSIIKQINNEKDYLIFVLWGGYAKKMKRLIDTEKHDVIESGHPSPLSANRGYWFGNRSFSKINALLKQNSLDEIYWELG